MKKYWFSFLFVSICLLANAQCGNRYLSDITNNLITHKDIEYGKNTDNKGTLTALLLDVYEPENDTMSTRPLIIFVHGGSFVGGSRTDQDIDKNAQYFAKKGYVTANIEYRVEQTNFISPFVNFADKNNWYKAIIRVVHDINASIRYFKKHVVEEGNTFRIDTNQIIIYGSSAGAIGTLHSTFIDNLEEASTDFRNNFIALGGIEGNSGSQNYTSRNSVKAIVSCSGAIDNLNYLNNNKDIKMIAFHHAVDLTVPYDKGCFISVACFLNQYYGSKQMAQKAKPLGITHEFYTFDKIDHPADKVANAEDRAFLLQITTEFLHKYVVCTDRITSIRPSAIESFSIYPNPASKYFSIEYLKQLEQKNITLQISNMIGEIAVEKSMIANSYQPIEIDLSGGLYLVKIIDTENNDVYLSKLLVK